MKDIMHVRMKPMGVCSIDLTSGESIMIYLPYSYQEGAFLRLLCGLNDWFGENVKSVRISHSKPEDIIHSIVGIKHDLEKWSICFGASEVDDEEENERVDEATEEEA